MISTNDFKNGITIEVDNSLWNIVEFLHVKPGKGSAFVRTKLKNLYTGNVMEKTFRAGEKVSQAIVEKRDMQYLYQAGESLVLMNNETFEQIEIPADKLGDKIKYLKENIDLAVLSHEDTIITVEIPNFIHLKVIDTPPSERGNTATGGTKPATLETGAVVNVPFFVNVDDTINVDTRTDSYLERV